MDTQNQYEKLGLLYLGRERLIPDGQLTDFPFLYKSKNLTTHGVIIGMTGSGKTGLGIGLIEETIMDDIPSIIIDPKGDMSNLLLTFPELRGEDFAPWVDPSEASRKKLSVADYAEKTASSWREGLNKWGQGKERIRTLAAKAQCTVYTPGSSTGVPISIISGFKAPGADVLKDHDTLNSLVGSTVTSLLALIDVAGDPLTSREHILISSILLHHWRKGEDLTLESVIGAIVNPPFEKVGVFGLTQFFPQNDRMKLAMQLNNVIASPSFSTWLTGEQLDIQKILYGEDGRPRTAIFSIAHLAESERMFFVTLLLNAIIGWMRRQQGTSSLKALLYMDEIYGYFPPSRNPPSKKPMMLLLKQARAFGLGVVLSTQNPVDLDYKGLSNIGTWFIGRLQTSQDQKRVLDGIVGSSDGSLDKSLVKKLLSDMKGRQFLLKSAHLDEPLLFETRWVMSYLKGPISLQEIGNLMANKKIGISDTFMAEPSYDAPEDDLLLDAPAILSEGVDQRYHIPPLLAEELLFEPWLAGSATVRFYNSSRNIDEVKQCELKYYLDSTFRQVEWTEAEAMGVELDECLDSPPENSSFYRLPDEFDSLKNLSSFRKSFSDYLYQSQRLELLRAPTLKLESRPGDSESDFRARINDHLREQKEIAAEKLLAKFKTKRERLEKKLDSALVKIEKEKGDVAAKRTDTLLSIGTAVLGAFFGRKALSSTTITRTASGIRKAGQMAKEKGDVARAEAAVADIEAQITQLNEEQGEALEALVQKFDPEAVETEVFSIKPRRSDIYEVEVCLLWGMVPPRPSVNK